MRVFIVFIFLIHSVPSKCQNWLWSNAIGSHMAQTVEFASVITDGTNTYLIGEYSGILNFQSDTLINGVNNSLFVAKYDVNGNEVWVRGFSGSGGANNYDFINGVFNFSDNHIYLSGRFYSQMIMGDDTLLSISGSDIFLSKIDVNGNFIWSKSIKTPGVNDYAYVFIQPDGNILMTGVLGGSANLDTFSLLQGGFFSRFDTAGSCVWARNQFNGIHNQEINISFFEGSIFMAGFFQANQLTLDTAVRLGTGNSLDAYLVKFDSIGQLEWVETFANPGIDVISGLDIDSLGNIYITGTFEDSIQLDNIKLYNSGSDIFIAKYDINGNCIWAQNASSITDIGGGTSLAIDKEGGCYVTGNFTGPVTFGNYSVISNDTLAMFLVRYNSNGDCMGIKYFGYAGGSSVKVDNLGNAICSGGFRNTVMIGSSQYTSISGFDIYFAKCEALTGVSEVNRLSRNVLEIYANPTSGKCNITIPDEFIHERNLTLAIYNLGGKIIKRIPINMSEEIIKLNLDTEAKGVYNAFLSNGVIQYEGKIIFE